MGVDGAPGEQGDQGPTGDTGAQGNDGERGDQGPMGPPGPEGAAGADGADGLTRNEVQDMIDQACQPLLDQIRQLEDALKDAFRPGDLLALQSSNGLFICAEQGGPSAEGREYILTGKDAVSVWESFTAHKGVR